MRRWGMAVRVVVVTRLGEVGFGKVGHVVE